MRYILITVTFIVWLMVLHIYMASLDLMATDERTDVNSGAADGNRDDFLGSSDDISSSSYFHISLNYHFIITQTTNHQFINSYHSCIRPL